MFVKKYMQSTKLKAIISWVALGVFVSITRPASLPIWGLIIPFVMLYFALSYTLRVIVEYSTHASQRLRKIERWLPIIVSLSVVMVLALQSIGQLSLRDVFAVVLLVLIGYFYVNRNGSKIKK